MWSDTLMSLERAHILRLILWGGGSVLLGTIAIAWHAIGRKRSSLVQHFAVQTALWGALAIAIGLWQLRALSLRNFDSAAALLNMLWLNVGLSAGCVGVGIAIATCSWRFGRRLAAVGAGIGIVVQGLALGLLSLLMIAQMAAARAA